VITPRLFLEQSVDQDAAYEREVDKNYRHNAIFNFLDGAIFWFGLSFMAPAVIMPLFVSHYTNSSILIGLVAVISSSGFYLPQLFTANWVEHLPLKKKAVVVYGFFTERVPVFFLAPAALLTFVSGNLALTAVLVAFALHSFGAGFTGVAWQDMLAKVIPLKSRGKFLGITTFAGMTTGILGASVATWLLSRFAFPNGYIISFALAAVFIFLSWIAIAQTREVPVYHREIRVTNKEYWKSLPAVIKGDPNFRRYIISQMVINLGSMAWGFLAVYALQRWDLSDGKVSLYNVWLLAGQAIANLVFGALADRKGYKLILEIGIFLSLLSLAIAILAPSPSWFTAVFLLRGIGLGGGFLSLLFILEFSSPAIRPTYIGLNNTITGLVSATAPLLGGILAGLIGYQGIFQVALVCILAGLALLHFTVRDPRKDNLQPAAEISTTI
jgi:MFS family permease